MLIAVIFRDVIASPLFATRRRHEAILRYDLMPLMLAAAAITVAATPRAAAYAFRYVIDIDVSELFHAAIFSCRLRLRC